MNVPQWEIRPQYISMVNRYRSEQDTIKKIEMKHKFISWLQVYSCELTDAEKEYLQTCICPVEDIY